MSYCIHSIWCGYHHSIWCTDITSPHGVDITSPDGVDITSPDGDTPVQRVNFRELLDRL